MSWDDVLLDPEFQKQPFPNRLTVAKNFFAQNIEANPGFAKQTPEIQQTVRSNFFRTLGKVPAESGVKDALSGKGLGTQIYEAGSQLHLDLNKMATGLVKGLTMGAVDIDDPYVNALIEQRKQRGEWTTAEGQKVVGEFIGEFFPIAASYKMGGLLLAKYSTPIVSPAIKALAEGAYSGLIYGLAKGVVNGKSWDETLSEGGWTAVGFGAGGAALTKATQGTGFVISKLRKMLGKEKIAELENSLSERLAAEITANRKTGTADSAETLKKAKWYVQNIGKVDPKNPASGAAVGNVPTIGKAPQVKARGRTMEPTYTEKHTYGYPGGGPPAVRPPWAEAKPFSPRIVQPGMVKPPLQIEKKDIIFAGGTVADIPAGKMGPGRYGRPFAGPAAKDPMEKIVEAIPERVFRKPSAGPGTVSPRPVPKAKPGPKAIGTSPASKFREQLKKDLDVIQQNEAAGRITASEAHSKTIGVYIKELDNIDAPDSSYRSLFSTAAKQTLKAGDTWRDFAVRYSKRGKGDVKIPEHLLGRIQAPEGMPVVEVTKKELAEAAKRQQILGQEPSSIKAMLEDDIIEMWAGLPLPQAKKYMAAIRRRLGTKGHPDDLPTLTSGIMGLHTPYHLSEIGGPARSLVTNAWEYNHRLNKVPVHKFLTRKDKYLKGLKKDDKKSVAILLNNYNKVTDIPPNVLRTLPSNITKAFTGIRSVYDQVWHRVIHNKIEAIPATPYVEYVRGKGINMPGLSLQEKGILTKLLTNYNSLKEVPPQLLQTASQNVKYSFDKLRSSHAVPKKVSGYLTRLFTDLKGKTSEEAKQVIRNFADENNIDYTLAMRIVGKRVPKKAYFGPLSEERSIKDVDLSRVMLDLDFLTNFYMKGAGRKMFMDRFLPEAGNLLKQVPEGSNVHNFMKGYIDQLRGLPMNSVEKALNNIPDVYTTIRGKQVLLIPNARKILKYEGLRQGITKLGGNLSFLFFNLLQYPVMDGTKFISGALKSGLKGEGGIAYKQLESFAKGSLAVFNKRGRRYANNLGVTLDVGKGEIPLRDIPGLWAKVNTFVNLSTKYVESYNRTASANANRALMDYLLPRTGTMLTAVERQRLIDRAVIRGVGETQFYMDVTGKPAHLAGPFGSAIGRFKPYSINFVERLANYDAAEWVTMLGILDLIGGPNGIPGVRQLAFDLNDKYPNSIGAKILGKMGMQEEARDALNKMQKYSLAGVTGVDIGKVTGLGFIPGGSAVSNVWRDFSDDFWGTLGEEMVGVLGGDIKNFATLVADVRSGQINLKDPDVMEILQHPAVTAVVPLGVQVKRTARAFAEWENKYQEYRRDRPGPELGKQEIVMRGLGFQPTKLTVKEQVYKDTRVRIEEAFEVKARIEDRIISLTERLGQSSGKDADKIADMLGDTYKDMEEFNEANIKEVGIYITPESLKTAFINKNLPVEQRIAKSKLQYMLLRERLEQHLGQMEE